MLPKHLRRNPPLAWRNLTQAPIQFGLAIAAISFAVMLMFVQLGILGAVLKGATLLYDELNFDLVLISQKSIEVSFSLPFSQRRLYQVEGIPGVQFTKPFYLALADWFNLETQKLRPLMVMAFDLKQPVFKSSEINAQIPTLKQQDTVIINRRSSVKFGPQEIGTIAELRGREVKIVNSFTMYNSFRFDGSVITSSQNFVRYFLERSPDDINLGLITLEDGADVNAVKAQIRTILPQSILVFSRSEIRARDQYHWLISTSTGTTIGFGVITALMIGAVIIYQILKSDVEERLSEYGTLKAIGYSNQKLATFVLQQATILAVIGYTIGLGLAFGVYEIMAKSTSLPISMSLSRIIIVLALTISMCNASGLLSLQKLIKLDPYDVFG